MVTCRVCFDIETEPFSDEFRYAKSIAARQRHAPRMRLACVYSEVDSRYHFYTPNQATELIAHLQGADEVISFNGKGFDLLVLRAHYGLKGKLPRRGRHIDLYENLTAMAGFRVSLDRASQVNLNERKHTSGREMSKLELAPLKEACQSDVSQTYRLWLAHSNDELRAPDRPFRQSAASELIGGPGSHIPSLCPVCHDVASLEFVESDMEDMTDGQFAEYMAGTQGVAICASCSSLVVWNV